MASPDGLWITPRHGRSRSEIPARTVAPKMGISAIALLDFENAAGLNAAGADATNRRLSNLMEAICQWERRSRDNGAETL